MLIRSKRRRFNILAMFSQVT